MGFFDRSTPANNPPVAPSQPPQATRPAPPPAAPEPPAPVVEPFNVERFLASGEEHVATLETKNRDIVVTSRRVVLVEHDGDYAVLSNAQIAAFEVSAGPADQGDAKFVKVFFGGGLSRTLMVASTADAETLVGVLAR